MTCCHHHHLTNMKRKSNIIPLLAATTLATVMHLSAHGQTIDTLTIESTYGTGFNFVKPPHNIKALQTSNRKGGVIDLNLPVGMPEERKQSILVAAGYWEPYLPCDTLKLNVHYTHLEDVDVKTEIYYFPVPSENYCCPLAMKRHQIRVNNEAPLINFYPQYDAEVTINSWEEWNIGIGECDGKNLTYAFMQAIGHALGFTSSLIEKKREIKFKVNGCRSNFDNLIFSSNGTSLSNIPANKDSLRQFVESPDGYLYIANTTYKLYAPSPYEPEASLRYFFDDGMLMSATDNSNKTLAVDSATRYVLSAIGWDMELGEPEIEITCNGVDSTGIMSAYTSHTFSVTTNAGTVSDWQWEATLPLANGTEQTMTGSSATFTLPALTNEQQYARTVEGDVRCLIRFTGTVSGDTVTAEYRATLELKPVILSTNILAITRSNIDGRYKNVTVGVRYAGSHYASLEMEEESNYYTKWYYSDVPYYTTHTFEDIYTLEPAWLNVTVRNAYGSTYTTLQVFEGAIANSRQHILTDCPTLEDVGEEVDCDLFTLDGRHLGHIQGMEDLKRGGYTSGIYLLKYFVDGECVTKKIRL